MTEYTSFGFGDRQRAFQDRHTSFFERFERLREAVNDVFNRTITADELVDPIVFYLGSRAVDDFLGVLILSANDNALSATALLRGMYERVVTARYLHDHPGETLAFFEFGVVQQRRTAQQIRRTFPITSADEHEFEQLEQRYQAVKTKFLVACEKCGHQRVGATWSKLDFVSLASKTGDLGDLIVPGYYWPTAQAHATLRSVESLLEQRAGEPPTLKSKHIDESDRAFQLAYLLLIHVLQIQWDHFKLPLLEKALEIAAGDYQIVYPPKDEQPLDA
ncbi:MAG TPA: DUF5677 domain-containing protein [Thermoanaerobaculia bacterium]|nr:DUF5677 domain-containing protein [Thermoanaerobaculia bacterium]